MVKLAISAITDEFSMDFKKVCEYFQQQEIGYVEIRSLWITTLIDARKWTVGRIKDILNDTGLKVSCIAGPLLKCYPASVQSNLPKKPGRRSVRNWNHNTSKFDRTLDLARTLGAKYIRCFGYHGNWPVPPLEEWQSWQVYQEWQNTLNEFKTKCKVHGKALACENEGGINQSLEQMEKIGRENADDNFGMLYDMANVANRFGKKGILTDEWLPRITPYIKYIHAKGSRNIGIKNVTTYVNGKGDTVRWPQVVDYLRDIPASNFVGAAPDPLFLSIETHMGGKNRWEKSAQSLQNLKDLLGQ